MTTEQEKTTPEAPKVDSWETTIEATKQELALAYVDFLDKQKGGMAAMVGDLNPLKQDAVNYLLDDNKSKTKKGGTVFEKIIDNADGIFKKKTAEFKTGIIEKVTWWAITEYDKNSLNKMKALIIQCKDNQTELENLKDKIDAGIDPTEDQTITPNPTSPEKSVEPPTKVAPEKNILVGGALLGWTLVTISQTDIDFVNSEKEKIEPKITGDFASIKEVRNTKGEVILEAKGESPYIHKDVRPDLLTLALLFFQKTNHQALSITSAFRTHSNQEKLKETKKNLAATPGYSGHELWRSFDIDTKDRYAKKIWGIEGFKEIAKKCNFNPLTWEDWHFDHETLPKAENRPAIAQVLDKEYKEKLAA